MVIRNATDLLYLHETFVKLLETALEPLGFASVFAPASMEKGKRTSKGEPDPKAMQNVDDAVATVAEVFTREVCRLRCVLSTSAYTPHRVCVDADPRPSRHLLSRSMRHSARGTTKRRT